MPAPARIYTGASHADLCKLLDEFATVIRSTRHLDGEKIADALGGFADTLANLHSESGDDRDALTVDEHRAAIGICPDGGAHFFGPACRPHECPTFLTADYEDYMADTGRLR
jgi:hypothetical protein